MLNTISHLLGGYHQDKNEKKTIKIKPIHNIDTKTDIDNMSEIDSDNENENDSEFDSNEIEIKNILENYISKCNKDVYFNGKRILLKCPINIIKEAYNNQEIDISDYNRMIDFDYINKIKDNFNPLNCDPIILAKRIDKNNKFEIIDGQHRLSFIIQTNDFNILNSEIPIDIRLCNNDEELKNYINIANNRKNFDSSSIRKFKILLVLDELNKKFNNPIFAKNRPLLNEDTLKTRLAQTKYFGDFQNTPKNIVNKIILINNYIKKYLEDNNLFKQCKKKGITPKMIDKCSKINLYLGLNKELSWCQLLDRDINDWNKLNIDFI